MLMFQHLRPNGRNDIQHPQPSVDFAHSFIQDFCLQLKEDEKLLLGSIIDAGTRRDGYGQQTLLFNHAPSQENDRSFS